MDTTKTKSTQKNKYIPDFEGADENASLDRVKAAMIKAVNKEIVSRHKSFVSQGKKLVIFLLALQELCINQGRKFADDIDSMLAVEYRSDPKALEEILKYYDEVKDKHVLGAITGFQTSRNITDELWLKVNVNFNKIGTDD